MKCGLLGQKLGHSYSPLIHNLLGLYSYELFEKEPQELEDFLLHGDFDGLNVTMPYKKAVIPYMNELTPVAKNMGSVNTIIRRDGKLIGHNTDYYGFFDVMDSSGLRPYGKKCLVLGSGGASNVAVTVLKEFDANVVVISRTGENNYDNLHLHKDAVVIVNATPVGMYPDTGVSPIDLDLFPHLEGVVDMIYNPAHTQLLFEAEKRGLTAVNGLVMLLGQAIGAATFFTGELIDREVIWDVFSQLQFATENIVLIGMPGCGKTTIGKLLAEKYGKPFVDTDEEVEKLTGRTVSDIITQDGEAAFRELETQVLAEFGKRSGQVIATGGGCVTQIRNYPLLHQNGRILYLRRDPHLLATEGRPLSTDLQQMYTLRDPLYDAFSDYIVDNNGSIDAIMDRIWRFLR